jgi:hypothetical protein
MQDYAIIVSKNCNFLTIRAPKPENSYTTKKFRKFYPISKKIAPDLESGCASYGLPKSDCKNQNPFGEGLHQRTVRLNLMSI